MRRELLHHSLFFDLPDEIVKGVLDVDSSLGRGLKERTRKGSSQFLALFHCDLTIILEIALVCHKDDGHFLGSLHSQNVVSDGGHHLKGRTRGDGINQQEGLASLDVSISHGTVLFLTSCVNDVEDTSLSIDGDLLAKAVLDGGIVLFDKLVRDQLEGETGLANSSISKDHELVFDHCFVLLLLDGFERRLPVGSLSEGW
jgi:hypothetical protein